MTLFVVFLKHLNSEIKSLKNGRLHKDKNIFVKHIGADTSFEYLLVDFRWDRSEKNRILSIRKNRIRKNIIFSIRKNCFSFNRSGLNGGWILLTKHA